jgi:kumamolisin
MHRNLYRHRFLIRSIFISSAVMSAVGCSKDLASLAHATATLTTKTCAPAAIAKNHGKYLPLTLTDSSDFVRPLVGHVPLETQYSVDLGSIDDSEPFTISIVLGLNNPTQLQTLLNAIYSPTDPNYHHFLTPQEFETQFYPTADQISAAKAYLLMHGFTLKSDSNTTLMIHAEAPAGVVETVFHTEIHRFKEAASKKTYFAPLYELQVPSQLAIRAVHGLDNLVQAHHHAIFLDDGFLEENEGSHRRSKPSRGFTPSEIKTAYNLHTPLSGDGQVMALVELDGYDPQDILEYEKQFNLNAVPLRNLSVGEVKKTHGDGAAEVTLDIELMIAMAPRAKELLVYQGSNSAQGILDLYQQIATDNQAQVVSTSWGMSESTSPASFLQSENDIFKQMAAQGQSVFAASGDSGAYDHGDQLAVDDPAAQPFVIGVGGTRLSVNPDGSYESETTWNDSSNGGGGGGGISSVWPIPSWQAGIGSARSKISSTQRNVPDVALNADPKTGYAIYFNHRWIVAGGTSCAAPLWGGFFALVNQNRQSKGMKPIGFAAPALYGVGKSSQYLDDFHDIVDGSTNFYYPAMAGFDDATGWGSFRGDSLLSRLSVDPVSPNPQPTPTASTTSTPVPITSATPPPPLAAQPTALPTTLPIPGADLSCT